MEERINWSKTNNIKTHQIIYEEACIEQELYTLSKFPNISPDLTIEQMDSLGIIPKLCDYVEKYCRIGILQKYTEPDGSISFENTIKDKGYLYVINESGLVIVGDKLFQITANSIKSTPYNPLSLSNDSQRLIKAKYDDPSNQIFVLDLTERSASKTIGDIFNQNSNNWVWYYNSSNERFNHYVFIHSYYISNPEGIYSQYFTSSRAEKKILGVWVKSSGYKPIMYLGGTWNWQVLIGPYYPNPNSWMFQTGSTSPYYQNFGSGSNEEFEYLFPTGNTANVTPSAPNIWSGDEVEILDMHIYGSFAGGCCGYSSTLR